MKIDSVKHSDVTTNINSDDVTTMTISVDGMEHIMNLLTNLYKDPELAVIREYFTNAVDAHVAVGQTAPVIVTLPTWDSPMYVVQDSGIGMSTEDIKNIYAQYGASTKRNTNDQVGAFGLGCKSALTTTDQFTVISNKNGIKSTVLISKTESGVNTVNIVNVTETPEANGTTVKIPIPDEYSFNSKASKFFNYCNPEVVLIDGKAPTGLLENWTVVEELTPSGHEIRYNHDRYVGTFLVMGNVPYTLDREEITNAISRLIKLEKIQGISSYALSDIFNSMGKIFSVTIGSVDLTPSREGLRFTEKTNDVLDELLFSFYESLREIASSELEATTSLRAFYRVKRSWKNIFPASDALWEIFMAPERLGVAATIHEIRRDQYGTSHSEGFSIDLDSSNEYFLITDLEGSKYKKINSYITPFMSSRSLDYANFLVVNDETLVDNEWILKAGTFTPLSFQTVIDEGKAFKAAQRKAAKAAGISLAPAKIAYPVLNLKTQKITMVPYNELKPGTPYIHKGMTTVSSTGFYDFVNMYGRNGFRTGQVSIIGIARHLKVADKSAKNIIIISGARTEKAFLDRTTGMVSFEPKLKALTGRVKKAVTDDLLAYSNVKNSSWYNKFNAIGLLSRYSEIEDMHIVGLLEGNVSLNRQLDAAEEMYKSLAYFGPAGWRDAPRLQNYDAGQAVSDKIFKKYPLLKSVSGYYDNLKEIADHSLLYINTVNEVESVNA